jgi:hypothetical protein
MTEEQKAAYLTAMAAGGIIEALGMHALNQHRLSRGETIAYDSDAFYSLMEDRGLHHNAIMAFLRD